ncbi:MAG: invasion associated locus B family protein [Acetobacter sp.]|uniref:invasion associated locus B family protein n=1 Tax=Acetobacter sp. TaxID=440 RepID=UPI0039EC7A2D
MADHDTWCNFAMNKKTMLIAGTMGIIVLGGGYGLHDRLFPLSTIPTSANAAVVTPKQERVSNSLPNGVSALTETYQAWKVMCGAGTKGETCVVSQQVSDSKSHKNVMTIQFHSMGKTTAGVVVLPLGVRLADGVIIRVDGKTLGKPFMFETCIPAGCLAPLTLDEAALGALQSSKKAEFSFSAATGQHVALPITVSGLDQAMARMTTLSR